MPKSLILILLLLLAGLGAFYLSQDQHAGNTASDFSPGNNTVQSNERPTGDDVKFQLHDAVSSSPAQQPGESRADSATGLRPEPSGSRKKPELIQDTLITAENVGMRLYANTEETVTALLRATDEQDYEPAWSSRATDTVNSTLIESGIRKHAEDWNVDCRATICTITFPDSALTSFDEAAATSLFEQSMFERVLWYRQYHKDTAYLFLVTSQFTYDAG